MTAIVGRDAELASIRDFVARVLAGPLGLVFEGDAGMGKTTLWRAAVDHAQSEGLLVLQAQPVESETTLSFTGIGDILDPVLDDVLAALPAPQRAALTRALALGDDGGPELEPRTLRVAVLNALRLVAEQHPVLVAIDDSQWLDYASSAVLAYGLRRLRTEPLGLVLARRSGLESVLLEELLRSPAGERFTRVELGPLDAVALGRAVQQELGATLPRPVLAEVHAASGGNPFYALEIVRALRRTGFSIEAGQPLQLPESLHELVQGRIRALPDETRDFLLAAAAHAHPTIAVTAAASGITREVGLVSALDARVVELDGDRIRFTHPLLAAGVYQAAGRSRWLEVHRRLAELLEDPEARAWQLAASVVAPEEGVAAALEDAARHARARGALRPAALLLDRAEELTSAGRGDDRFRRAVEAARLHYEAGDSPRADAQLDALVDRLPPGPKRARALVRLARVRSYERQRDAVDLFLQALAEAEDELEVLASAHEGLSACFFRLRERLEESVEHAEIAGRLALELGDEALAAEALASKLLPETLLGRESAAATAARALELQDAAGERRVLAQPLWMTSVYWWWTDDLERAHVANEQMLRRAAELGDESSVPYVLVLLGLIECTLGRYESALERALEGREVAAQSGQPALVSYHFALEALAAALLGREEEARSAARRALELVPETAGRPAELVAVSALGTLELSLSEHRAAAEVLAGTVDFVRRQRFGEPAAMRFVVDHVEALVSLGRLAEARELLDWYEGHAQRLERASALAACARCRGLLAAAEGMLDDALALYADALEWHERVELPLDRGRTLLAFGAALRRAKRRRDARDALEQALGLFERIGAALWAERTRAELRRISGRAPSAGALTPAEERVAALVAEGRTNREVAAALFLSQRTVEGHLSKVFAKLGIRHRAELAAALSRTRGIARSNTGDAPVSAGPVAP
jgi:DNA-binding CsgD family transcriptional regulator